MLIFKAEQRLILRHAPRISFFQKTYELGFGKREFLTGVVVVI